MALLCCFLFVQGESRVTSFVDHMVSSDFSPEPFPGGAAAIE